jgi:hypothetical protein
VVFPPIPPFPPTPEPPLPAGVTDTPPDPLAGPPPPLPLIPGPVLPTWPEQAMAPSTVRAKPGNRNRPHAQATLLNMAENDQRLRIRLREFTGQVRKETPFSGFRAGVQWHIRVGRTRVWVCVTSIPAIDRVRCVNDGAFVGALVFATARSAAACR